MDVANPNDIEKIVRAVLQSMNKEIGRAHV